MSGDRITFWFGCNMLRHAEMIRLCMMLLERVGHDVSAAGGPAYCCGTTLDHQPQAASNVAARTIGRFNEAAEKDGRETVVTWCPSCHMHMTDIMAPGNVTAFEISHITELLAKRRDRLAGLLAHPVNRRVLLHRHSGFATHVTVNARVVELLSLVPGQTLIEGPAEPGHMCSALSASPGVLASAIEETFVAASTSEADTICTIFHSCHREFVALDGRNGVQVRNWVQLLAEAMGIETADAYRDWRKGGAPDVAAIERADPSWYQTLIEPELRRPAAQFSARSKAPQTVGE
jgi:Fe-S oxidoreductase